MVETGLFRVLQSPHDDAWLFVPVPDGDPSAATGDDASDASTATGSDGDGEGDPVPGVPDVGDDRSGSRAGRERAPDDGAGTESRRSFDPVAVPRSGHGDCDDAVASLLPGYLVRATLSWEEPRPRVRALTVVKRTLFAFADDVVDVFEAAEAAWAEAAATGEPMASRVTRGTDGEVNGVLYVFADADGGDRLAEFRSGRRPLEPLLQRVNPTAPAVADRDDPWDGDGEDDAPSVAVGPGGIHVHSSDDDPAPDHGLGRDREVFVLRPADGPYVVVLVILRKAGTLANTVRDTYNCPRPEE